MRTNIDLDDELIAKAMKVSGTRTKKAAVDAALRLMVRIHGQTEIRKLRGTVQWEGNLDESRMSRTG
jgi:Arc/MetJ family transcription regulator